MLKKPSDPNASLTLKHSFNYFFDVWIAAESIFQNVVLLPNVSPFKATYWSFCGKAQLIPINNFQQQIYFTYLPLTSSPIYPDLPLLTKPTTIQICLSPLYKLEAILQELDHGEMVELENNIDRFGMKSK